MYGRLAGGRGGGKRTPAATLVFQARAQTAPRGCPGEPGHDGQEQRCDSGPVAEEQQVVVRVDDADLAGDLEPGGAALERVTQCAQAVEVLRHQRLELLVVRP